MYAALAGIALKDFFKGEKFLLIPIVFEGNVPPLQKHFRETSSGFSVTQDITPEIMI
jgi:hypothetical protein